MKEVIGNCPHCNAMIVRRVDLVPDEANQSFVPLKYETPCYNCKKRVRVIIGLQAKVEPIF